VLSCISKKPAERPATAANLARAAQALRRGDVAAATVAVPAVGGAGTVAFNPPQRPGDDAATALIGTSAGAVAGPPGTPGSPVAPEDEEPRKKRAWIWWLVGIVALLVIGGVVAAFAINGSSEPDPTRSAAPSPSATRETPSSIPTPTATPTSTRVVVNKSDYVGRSTEDARAALQGLGFQVNVQDGSPAPSADQANTVADLTPTGSVTKGALITITQYTTPPTANKPNSPSAGTVSDSGQVTFSWSAATCPDGYSVSKYTWTVSNGKDASGATSGDTTSTAVTIQADAAGKQVVFAYNVTCASQSGGTLAASENSDSATATWEPTDVETPTDPGQGTDPTGGPQDAN